MYSFIYWGGVMSLRVPTSLRLWTICVSRDMTSGTRRDAQGRSSKKGAKMGLSRKPQSRGGGGGGCHAPARPYAPVSKPGLPNNGVIGVSIASLI